MKVLVITIEFKEIYVRRMRDKSVKRKNDYKEYARTFNSSSAKKIDF